MTYGNQMYGQVPYNNGYNYGGMQPPKRSNVLTDEQIAMLRQKGAGFTLALTKEEVLRGQCTHLDENGYPAYITNPDGTSTCTVCGHTWRSSDLTNDDVEKATHLILDILQTIKIMYVNMPEQSCKEFMQIIPMIEKIPKLYQIASDNFRSYEGSYAGYVNGAANPFALFGTLAGNGGYANIYQYQQTQPYYNNYNNTNYGNGGGTQIYNHPQFTPPYQQPVAQNPFDANAYSAQVQQGYTPQTQGFTYNPGQPAASPTPAQPAPAPAPTAQAEVVSNGNHTP
jgi:hypothetical protein